MSDGPIEVNRPRIVAFDIESTGTNPETDRIVELCLATPQGRSVTFCVNPGVPIPPDATKVHGITDADVAHEPAFAAIAPKVQAWIEGAVLLGYNSRSFDTPMLHAELRRAGQPGIDLDAVQEIDIMRIWAALEPRSLSGASRRWLGEEHAGAHHAKDDVTVTLRVWAAMRDAFHLSHADEVRLTKPPNEVDRAGKFAMNERDEIVYNFGKHQGKPVHAVDPAYLEWMAGADFPQSTKAVVQRIMLAGRRDGS
jgi:DNA polymerase-3 subunit epsilon